MAFALHEMKVMLATMFGMGLRLELELESDRGRVYALTPLPGASAGDRVGIRITGGARFPGQRQAGRQDAAVPSDPPHRVMP